MLKIIPDTNVLMNGDGILDRADKIIIPLIVIQELDRHKNSSNPSKSYLARTALRFINNNSDKVDFIVYSDEDYKHMEPDDVVIDYCTRYKDSETVLVTLDLNMSLKAKAVNIPCLFLNNNEVSDDGYTGFKEFIFDEDEMADFYTKKESGEFGNFLNILTNQYVIIKNDYEDVVDTLRWTGEKFVGLSNKKLESSFFDNKIQPKDIYQKMVVDSIQSNDITLISGSHGSGKSLIAMASAFTLIKKKDFNRIVILFNPVPVKGSTNMGYYSGSQVEKAMQSNIGQILITKLGDRLLVDSLINQGIIKLVPMADCRGMEISENEILWITEAQNTSIDLLKISLSRVATGAKVIIEGDYKQVDSELFSKYNNGMRRAIEVLKGTDIFGCVELQNIYRSKLADLVSEF